jgi:4-hydroxybenzoate polyprenyltransferase
MLWAMVRQMRIFQWTKNLLVFLPVIAAHRIFEPPHLQQATLAFFAFGLCASSVYMINDWVDLPADRNHPRKKNRPLASGLISTKFIGTLIPLFLLTSVAFGSQISGSFLKVLGLYFLSTLAYTFFLKKIALIDVLLLAGLYTLRIFAGSAATGIPVSPWLLAFSMFMFLSLALAKRYAELTLLSDRELEKASRRGYSKSDMAFVPMMGISSGMLTTLVMALYVNGDHVVKLYRQPMYLWMICPLLLYWVGHVWLVCHRGKMHDDPVVFALRDPASFAVAALAFLMMVLAQ